MLVNKSRNPSASEILSQLRTHKSASRERGISLEQLYS